MHPNTTKRTETLVYRPMGWIGSIRCEKSHRDFMARTFVWIVRVQYVFQQVSCSYEMIPNAPKYYETHQNISFGSNGVDWVRSLRINPTWLCGMNFCINCTSSPRFCTKFHAVTKRSQMHPNTTKQTEILVLGPMGWIGCAFVAKNHDVIRGTDFCVNCSSSPRFAPSFLQLQNNPKCTQTLWNTPNTWVYGPMGWIRCVHCEKLQRDFLARTFVLIEQF